MGIDGREWWDARERKIDFDMSRGNCNPKNRTLVLSDRDGFPKGWEDDLSYDPDRPLTDEERGNMFFPERGDPPHWLEAAKRVCADCPVKGECRAWGIENESYGVWGGLSERQRRQLSPAEREQFLRIRRDRLVDA